MDRGVGAAAGLPGSDRKDLAIQALAGSVTVSDLAARHGVSRKFVYQQTHKARTVLNDAFSSATPDGEGVVQNGRFMGYIKSGQSRANQEIPRFACNPDPNHASTSLSCSMAIAPPRPG